MNTSVTLNLHLIKRQAVVLVTSSSIVLLHLKIVCGEDIIKIVFKFKLNKSPGTDNIVPIIIKAVHHDILQPLTYIYNYHLQLGLNLAT